jgi:hypothetical protein
MLLKQYEEEVIFGVGDIGDGSGDIGSVDIGVVGSGDSTK